MNRRDFNRTGLAALGSILLPTWRFAPRKVQQLDLSLFCDPESLRYDLSTPFLREGVTYATDARVAVRTSLIDAPPDDAEETRRRPSAERLAWRHDQIRGWKSWADWKRVASQGNTCPSCDFGFTGPLVTCTLCGGKGYFGPLDELPEPAVCDRCNETGKHGAFKCAECSGNGEVDYCYELGGVRISPLYLQRVATLGTVDCALMPGPNSEGEPVLFRFDGGEGLLMPLWPEPKR